MMAWRRPAWFLNERILQGKCLLQQASSKERHPRLERKLTRAEKASHGTGEPKYWFQESAILSEGGLASVPSVVTRYINLKTKQDRTGTLQRITCLGIGSIAMGTQHPCHSRLGGFTEARQGVFTKAKMGRFISSIWDNSPLLQWLMTGMSISRCPSRCCDRCSFRTRLCGLCVGMWF